MTHRHDLKGVFEKSPAIFGVFFPPYGIAVVAKNGNQWARQ